MTIRPMFKAGSTGVLTASFKDEEDNPVTPNEASWTLRRYGEVVNGRQDVVIDSLSDEVDIVLSGDDLVSGPQCLIINASYDSSLGLGLPLIDWIDFVVRRPCGP